MYFYLVIVNHLLLRRLVYLVWLQRFHWNTSTHNSADLHRYQWVPIRKNAVLSVRWIGPILMVDKTMWRENAKKMQKLQNVPKKKCVTNAKNICSSVKRRKTPRKCDESSNSMTYPFDAFDKWCIRPILLWESLQNFAASFSRSWESIQRKDFIIIHGFCACCPYKNEWLLEWMIHTFFFVIISNYNKIVG